MRCRAQKNEQKEELVLDGEKWMNLMQVQRIVGFEMVVKEMVMFLVLSIDDR
jgi:hypothetical protein